jgi:uncharacterized OsmC-like protein
MAETDLRRYRIEARSTETFGRVLWNCRNHHFVADGPEQNGCPGEAVTPAELFLSGVATCGVELLQVLARAQGLALRSASVRVEGTIDPARPVREDVSLFRSVRLEFHLAGIDESEAAQLLEAFKKR